MPNSLQISRLTLSLFLFTLFLSGCQSTAPESALPKISNPEITFRPETPNPEVTVQAPAVKNPEERASSILQRQIERQGPIVVGRSEQLPAELHNRQICLDDVNISYQVKDDNGYRQSYFADVQLQARLKAVDSATQEVKVLIKSWYSDNQNLRRWAPYLSEAPRHEKFKLQRGEEVWLEGQGWYFCRFSDDAYQTI